MAASLDDHALDGDDLLAALAFLDDFAESSAPSEVDDELHRAWQRDAVASHAPQVDALGPHDMLELSHILAASAQFQLPTAARQESPLSTISSSNNGSTDRQQRPARLAVREPNQARNKRREELLLLRKQVVQLEAQLSKLQIKERVKNNTSTCANCANNTRTALVTHPSHNPVARRRVWREISKNQGDRRLDAERENIRLKTLLGRQVQIAKSLQKHLTRAAANSATDRRLAATLTRLTPPPNRSDSDAALVESLLAGLEKSYAEIDEVYAASGLADSESSRVESRMRSHGANANHSLELEVAGTKVLPFEYDATVKATWDHYVFGIERIPSRLYYSKAPKVFLRASDAYIKTHYVELKTRATSANFGVKQVIRRFDEQDRVVIVLRSYIDPIEFGHELLPGVSFLEKGYIVIKKPSETAGSEDPLTLIQACHVLTPIFSGVWATSNENHPKLGAMADFILAVATANMRATHQVIEDELLQQAMKSSDV